MQGAMRSMSSSTFHDSLGGSGTSKLLLISMLRPAETFEDDASSGEECFVLVMASDELNADGHSVRSAMRGDRDRGHVKCGPEFLEQRLAGGVETFRRFAG